VSGLQQKGPKGASTMPRLSNDYQWVQRHGLEIVLAVLLALAAHGNYQRGIALSEVCELIGRHDVQTERPQTIQEEIDNICISHEPTK
jgi:hypothetical protein